MKNHYFKMKLGKITIKGLDSKRKTFETTYNGKTEEHKYAFWKNYKLSEFINYVTREHYEGH